jgi:phosphate-selective porin OprO/OprP
VLISLLLALALEEPSTSSVPAAATRNRIVPVQQQREAPQGLVAKAPPAEPPKAMRFVWREHPSLRAGENFRVDFSAKFQDDARYPGDSPLGFPTWEVHRMRVGIEGELFERIQYQVERELTERELSDPLVASTKSQWKDVFVEANYTAKAQARVGKFKIPYGLDQTSSEYELDFIYRSLGGAYLSPGRDIGAMVHGRFFDRGFNYWAGWFRQDGENSRSTKIDGADDTIAGRITVTPFRTTGLAGLHGAEVGVSFANSDLENLSVLPNGLRARTVLSQYTFFEPMFVNGKRKRYGADVDWIGGPFGARAEYMYVADTRLEQGILDEDLTEVRGRAWYVLGTALLTGDRKLRPVQPRRPLLHGGFGAVEIALRFDRLWFDSEQGEDPPFRNSRARTVLPSGDKVFTAGLNWYLNRWVKIQLNAIRENTEDEERSPIAGGTPFWSRVFRLQQQL